MQLPEHCGFVVFEKNSACFLDAIPSLIAVHAKQVLRANSSIPGSEEVVKAFKVFLQETTEYDSKRRVDSWTVAHGLVPVQTFTVHVMHFLGNVYKDAALFEKCQQISLLQWSGK